MVVKFGDKIASKSPTAIEQMITRCRIIDQAFEVLGQELAALETEARALIKGGANVSLLNRLHGPAIYQRAALAAGLGRYLDIKGAGKPEPLAPTVQSLLAAAVKRHAA